MVFEGPNDSNVHPNIYTVLKLVAVGFLSVGFFCTICNPTERKPKRRFSMYPPKVVITGPARLALVILRLVGGCLRWVALSLAAYSGGGWRPQPRCFVF